MLLAISVSELLLTVLYLVIIGVIFYAFVWFIDWVGIPAPFNKVAKAVVGICALVIVVNFLMGLLGHPFITP